jgi:hypothetical protein
MCAISQAIPAPGMTDQPPGQFEFEQGELHRARRSPALAHEFIDRNRRHAKQGLDVRRAFIGGRHENRGQAVGRLAESRARGAGETFDQFDHVGGVWTRIAPSRINWLQPCARDRAESREWP